VRASERVRSAAREPRHGERADVECVAELLDVVGEVDQRVVCVRRRFSHSGPLDADDPHVALVRELACLRGDLASRARRAVEPEQRPAAGGTELREAEAPPAR
jgi:hypothetical protein